MKLIWNLIVAFIIFNLLLAAGYVGWLYNTDYINGDRIDKAREVFSLTIAEEAAQAEEIRLKEEEATQARDQLARLESTGQGPTTLRDELDKATRADQSAIERINLFNQQNEALREEMARFMEDHNRRVAELEAERAAFEKWIQDRAEQTKDENFLQVVSLYEAQAPKQTKQAFQTLMALGETDQVVEYLAAMDPRKAGKVLAQFKTPEEVPQAASLLEKLRLRGEYTRSDQPAPDENQL